nr:MAG TPA: hypothetical protein [Caudoviricetes sp.]
MTFVVFIIRAAFIWGGRDSERANAVRLLL